MKPASFLAFLILFGFASPLAAQSEKWQIDADHSTALVSLLSTAHPSEPLNYGVEMVAGTMPFDPSNPSSLSFTLNIYPAEHGSELLNPDGTWRAGAYAQLSRYTTFTFFTSKSATRGSDGVLRVTGELTVAHVVRTAPSEGNVAYSGPSASATPEEHTLSRRVTLALEKSDADIAYGWKVGWMEIKGVATLPLENAPGLWDWVADSVFPAAVEDRRCHTPAYSVSMRDYRGVVCTGTLVAPEKPPELPRSNSTIDYSGARYATPESINQFRITLDLKVREPRSE